MIYKCWHCRSIKNEAFGLCPKCCKFPSSSQMSYLRFAKELNILQFQENNGRGISCVKQIIQNINFGDLEGAKLIYETDGDKISGNYPDIDKLICENLNIKSRYNHD